MMPISSMLFYLFASLMCVSGVLVITHRQPVYAILFLIKAIVCASVLWMIMQAEFLSLALIFVYVGAVMTLFLFVAMMLNVTTLRDRFWRSASTWLGILVASGVIYLLARAFVQADWANMPAIHLQHGLSNVAQIGHVLYSDYMLPVELSAMLLLVAMISAVGLTFHGKRANTKQQSIAIQTDASPKGRIRMVDLRSKES